MDIEHFVVNLFISFVFNFFSLLFTFQIILHFSLVITLFQYFRIDSIKLFLFLHLNFFFVS